METRIQRKKSLVIPITLVALLIVSALVIAVAFFGGANGSDAATSITAAKPSPSATTAPSPSATPEDCADSWPIVPANHEQNRWFYEGIASIMDANTNEEAVAASIDWREKVRQAPNLLVGAVKTFLQKDVSEASLTGSDGCVTQEAVDLDLELGMYIAASKITPDEAPINGVNTGVNDGAVVSDSSPGISGDRKAIKIVTPDGRTIWIMARCGNIVTESPVFPPGETDNPPKPTCPPEMPNGNWPNCKDEPTQDPGPRGNAPIGHGPNADPGPGQYIAPENMVQPPSTPYVPPAPPAPVVPAPQPPTPSNPNPAPVPTPDPAPAPSAEPSAPPTSNPVGPSDPGGGCLPPPGMTTC